MGLVWVRGLAFGLVGEERGLVVVRMRGVGAGEFIEAEEKTWGLRLHWSLWWV